jgi:hypothetical protein
MLATIQNVMECKQTIAMVDELVQCWFDDNKIPEEYRMSVPLMLLFEKKEKEGMLLVSLYLGVLYNRHVVVGNC